MEISQLKPFVKRKYVPEGAQLTDSKVVADLYQKLLDRAVGSAKELEELLLDRSELDAALGQAGSVLYINMTCHTNDKAIAEAYTQFIQTVPPAIKPINDKLNQRYIQLLAKYPLEAKRYEVYNRSTKIDIELFVNENISLQTKVEMLSQEYQTVCGAMTVQFEGKEQTLPQMGKYQLENDRQRREDAWRAVANRRLQDKDKLENIFDLMLGLRCQIASNAKFKDFISYQFKNYHRFDYDASDCKKYHQTVEQFIVPLYGEVLKKRQEEMKLDSLRPWDLAVDPLGRAALKPFENASELIQKTEVIFNKLDKELGAQFKEMKDFGLLDLESRKGKAPGGYQNTLSEARKPFIFMNAVGVDDDVRTLLHESGHAFHALAAANDPLVDYRHAPMEFCEVASMAMELLGGEYLNEFYSKEHQNRSNREHLEGIIHVLCWVANIDAFQQWIYENPQHRPEDRKKVWIELYQRFGGKFVNWQGLESVRDYLWHRQLHIFEVPFYYIEYGIAQLGSLQLWQQAKKDSRKALTNYRRGLSLGGSRPLPELYEAAGIKFDFSENIIKPLMQEVYLEWKKYV